MARARRVLVLLAVLPVVIVTIALARPVTRSTSGSTTSCLELEPPVAAMADQLNRFWRAEGVVRVCGMDARRPGSRYHAPEQTIYFDAAELRRALKKYSGIDASHLTWYVLAHEWGHHVQHSWTTRPGQPRPIDAALELQADCLAGYFMGRRAFSDRTHLLVVTSTNHLESSGWPDRARHGTDEERAGAYLRGLKAGGRHSPVAAPPSVEATPDAVCAAQFFQPGAERLRSPLVSALLIGRRP
jgi:Putative neutral zinc metallopeptidase